VTAMDTNTPPKATKRNLPAAVKISVQAGLDKKAENVQVLDLRQVSSFTDFFIVMNGLSTRQNQAIFEQIREELKKKKVASLGAEGLDNGEWILMDYGSFIIHIFSPRIREYYALEMLWGDAPRLDF